MMFYDPTDFLSIWSWRVRIVPHSMDWVSTTYTAYANYIYSYTCLYNLRRFSDLTTKDTSQNRQKEYPSWSCTHNVE